MRAPLSNDVLRAALAQHAAVAGRTQVRELADGTVIIDDSYNANPGSMRAALRAVAEVAEGKRVVCVLGEMKELGPFARAEHEALGVEIAKANVAIAIGCGGLIDVALDRAAAAGVEVLKAEDAPHAALLAISRVRPGDVVLVKGSRSVGTERVVEALASGGAA
jgi:UDP-N-acetylmuramoyl-tripeptide--D-alanyl-D-alanine ligase